VDLRDKMYYFIKVEDSTVQNHTELGNLLGKLAGSLIATEVTASGVTGKLAISFWCQKLTIEQAGEFLRENHFSFSHSYKFGESLDNMTTINTNRP
jgi:hypothetical protein